MRKNKGMNFTPLGIDGAWLVESEVWSDERGFFREWFKSEKIESVLGRDFRVEQANISVSSLGTLRGVHYSMAPRGQAKWVTCASGSIQDVIVDVRSNSRTFGQWVDIELKGNSGKSVFISEGLGHGFLALENNTTVSYLVSTPFSPTDEFAINPLDDKLGINWQINLISLNISKKDKDAPTLSERLAEGKLPLFP
jgi:dTDP-4-dehydrorhamnose 3,5-epimerase